MDRRTKRSGSEWVARWRASGLSGTVFAAKHGLRPSTLYGWARRIDVENEADVALPRFAEVRVRERDDSDAPSHPASMAAGADDATIEIVTRSGRVVRVGRGADLDVLAAVLMVVERC